jgi:hypothetical protein
MIQQSQESESWLRLSDKKINKFLFAVQGVGAVFVGIFLAAYLGGLPSTTVLHSEPAFRIPLFILGAVLVFLLVSAFVPIVLSED